MKRMVKFAVLQYVPNYERDEKINVAVVLHSPQDNFIETVLISNWKRLSEFDDELDINFMKIYLKGIKNKFNYNFVTDEEILKMINNIYLLDNMSKFYINQFVFKINELEIEEDCRRFLDKLRKNYLYYDNDKSKRVSQKESKKFFGELLKGKNVSYEIINQKNTLVGNYNEEINVDYKVNNDYYKIIMFDDKNINSYTPTIKMWMLNAHEMSKNNIKLVFVINDLATTEKTNKLIRMLEDYGKVIRFSEFDKHF